MKYCSVAFLALAAALAGPATAAPPTEPVEISSQREYVAHQFRCFGLLLDDAEHIRICGTMDGNNFSSIVSHAGSPPQETPPPQSEVPNSTQF